jgi:hypothetical protein
MKQNPVAYHPVLSVLSRFQPTLDQFPDLSLRLLQSSNIGKSKTSRAAVAWNERVRAMAGE